MELDSPRLNTPVYDLPSERVNRSTYEMLDNAICTLDTRTQCYESELSVRSGVPNTYLAGAAMTKCKKPRKDARLA